MLKTMPSSSLPIEGVLLFSLFEIRHSEPFIVMYGFSAAWGYQPTAEQKKLIYSSMYRRTVFESFMKIGAECKAGTRPMPEWVRNVEAVKR
jgi:hypothetical protein